MDKVCLILFMSFLTGAHVHANEDWSLAGKVSSQGLGLELGHPLSGNRHLNGRVAAYLFNYSDTITESGIDYDVSVQLRSAGLLLDWHPGGAAFRFTVGGYYNGNEGDMEAKSINGSFNINGTLYNVNDVGSLKGDLAYGSSAPYLGIGWGNVAATKRGWGMAWDLGVLYQGEPDIGLNVSCAPSLTSGQCATLTNDVEAESQSLRADLEDNKWYPVLSLGVQYRF